MGAAGRGGNGVGGLDLIDLSAIDANSRTANRDDAFRFIGTGGFTGRAGELRVVYTSGTEATIMGDVNGDGFSDMEVLLAGTTSISGSSFIL